MNYRKFLITKKKHYIVILQNGSKEPVKSDRPLWIDKIERRFADDRKYGKDPMVNILREHKAMETGLVQLDELAIKLVLQKDQSDDEELLFRF